MHVADPHSVVVSDRIGLAEKNMYYCLQNYEYRDMRLPILMNINSRSQSQP